VNSPRFSVVVRLNVQRPAYSAAVEEMVLREHLPVQVRIEARVFDVINSSRQDITIVPDQDSSPVVFDLRPLEIGNTDITLDFFQAGDPVGVAPLVIEVSPYEVAEGIELRRARPLQIQPDCAHPDIVLHVGWNQPASALQFTLIQNGGASWNVVTGDTDPVEVFFWRSDHVEFGMGGVPFPAADYRAVSEWGGGFQSVLRLGRPEFSSHAPKELSEISFGMGKRIRAHAKCNSCSSLHFSCFARENLAAADFFLWTETEPVSLKPFPANTLVSSPLWTLQGRPSYVPSIHCVSRQLHTTPQLGSSQNRYTKRLHVSTRDHVFSSLARAGDSRCR
jgi:hypothetical protein